MPSESGRLIEEVVRRHVHPVLKVRGFSRRGRVWNRSAGAFTQAVHLEAGRWNWKDRADFTVTLGVLAPSVYAAVWGKAPPPIARDIDCIVRADISAVGLGGHPAPHERDQSWSLDSGTDLDRVGREVAEALVLRGIPFLERFSSLESILAFLLEHPGREYELPEERLYAAVIFAELGNRERARELLLREVLDDRFDGWGPRARETAERLGMDLSAASAPAGDSQG